uniref:Uncharacterized protein n=1 Tax=Anopheles atroparvus TaxID=41427 RepID=A0A182JGU9_ANOAO
MLTAGRAVLLLTVRRLLLLLLLVLLLLLLVLLLLLLLLLVLLLLLLLVLVLLVLQTVDRLATVGRLRRIEHPVPGQWVVHSRPGLVMRRNLMPTETAPVADVGGDERTNYG